MLCYLELFASHVTINVIHKVKEAKSDKFPNLYTTMINKLSKGSGIKKFKLAVTRVPILGASIYESPLTKTRVIVTKGLLNTLKKAKKDAIMVKRPVESFLTHPNITKRLRALKILESTRGERFSG